MREQIEQKLKQIPEAPGIYRMLDAEGHIIYIGKSKCLKKRVSSYFVPNPKWEKAEKMVRFIHDIEITVTDTHLDAMLLECALIKKNKPYFNAMMKNDQKYVYLKIEEDYRKPPLKLVMEREKDTFGPLRSRGMVEDFIAAMRNLYPLYKEKRTYQFEYHILPVVMTKEQFEKNRQMLLELCKNPKAAERFIKRTEHEMKQAAANERFELAMRYRDLMQKLSYLKKALSVYENLMQRDVIYTVPVQNGYKYFYIRNGLVIDTKKESEQNVEKAEQYAEKIKNRELINAKPLSETEEYLIGAVSDKEAADFRAIVYGELCDNVNASFYL